MIRVIACVAFYLLGLTLLDPLLLLLAALALGISLRDEDAEAG